MALDVKTLFYLTIYVDAILGALLLFVWSQNLSIRAVAWWGMAHILRAVSIVLLGLYGTVSDLIALDLSNAILLCSYAVTWNGARVFDGRPTRPGALIAGAAIWVGLCLWPGFNADPHLRAFVSGLIVGTYAWLTAYEFWRGRAERLISRWPAIVILFTHGALFMLRSPLESLINLPGDNPLFSSAWLSVLSAESILFPISIAFILLAMSKERAEQTHKIAAKLDPLTGLPNRRAFLQDADQLRMMQIGCGRGIALLMIDLDHFKSINDRFGHSVGDRVLQIFAKTAAANLRSFDLIGRLGGEEFAAVLAESSQEEAVAVAERIRIAFAAAAAVVDGCAVGATTSVGVALMRDASQGVTALLGQADKALYRAKELGRNRVELAETAAGEPTRLSGATPIAAARGRTAA